MSRRYFGGTDNAELRAKIEAKSCLSMPECGEDDKIDLLAKAEGVAR